MSPSASLAIVILATSPATAAPPGTPVAAFTSQQIWGGDDGRTIAGLGLRSQAVYLFRSSSNRPSLLVVPPVCCLYEAALSPQGDLVAYSMIRSDARRVGADDSGWSVLLVDTTGREIAVLPRARQFRWSRDGERLAVLYAHHDTNWKWTPEGIGIWQRADGARYRLGHAPEDIRWGEGDTLYLGYSDRVDALDLARKRVSRTIHRGADVSPDDRFSVRHGIPGVRNMWLFDDRVGFDLQHCALYRHGSAAPVMGFEPFWVRSGAAGHLLCMVAGEAWSSPPGQIGLRTGLFDPRTLDMVAWFPGKPIGPTADQLGVIVLRGDTLAIEPLAPWRERLADGPRVRVRIDVETWGRGIRPLGTWFHEVGAGDWLPDHADMGGGCDPFFRVTRIVDQDRLEIEFAPGRYTVEAPGADPSQAGNTTLSRTRTLLRMNSTCGGYNVRLSVVD